MNILDGLKNVVANLGTGRDKAASSFYADNDVSAHDLLTFYRNSWLASRIVNTPAKDATRKWRRWRADVDQINKIEAEEKRLKVKKRTNEALISARLYGWSAIYMNTDESDQSKPLRPGKEIRSLVLLNRDQVNPKEIVRDINSEYMGKSEFYTLQNNGRPVDIHASRLVILEGNFIPRESGSNEIGGDSVLKSTFEAIRNADSTMSNIASLVFESKVDVFKFKGFAQMLEQHKDNDVIRRLTLQAAMKGNNGAVVLDGDDEYEQKNASFAGLPDVALKFFEYVSGAAEMPVTRLFGRAIAGLSGNGDGDERTYYDNITQMQENEIQPALSVLDDCIIHSALGSVPNNVYYEWAPLRQQTESEMAENFSKTATAARALAGNNAGEIIPLDALSDALVNTLTEMGVMPGLEKAIKDYGSLSEQSGFVGGEERNINDAAPRTLYVRRNVLNAKEIIEHYRAQGLDNLISAEDMHVTIMYSRNPVDWMKMGDSWQSKIEVGKGGPRVTELFGKSKDTVVLSFLSDELRWRHMHMVENGATWDWPDYQPHITVAYDFDGQGDAIEPWTGEIQLSEEIFEEVNEDWAND